jgi:cadherin 23
MILIEHVQPGVEKRKLPDTVDREEVDDLDDEPSAVCYFIVNGNDNGLFNLDRVSHILSLNEELDRERKSNYSLIIKATEDCLSSPEPFNLTSSKIPKVINSKLRRPKSEINRFTNTQNIVNGTDDTVEEYEDTEPESSQLVADDVTLVRVIVYIQDINDCAPKFIQKIFTGGVATSADFGSEIMQIRAIDADYGENAKLSYFQVGKIHRTLAEGLDTIKEQPFLIDKETGSVKLNFDPQKGMKGYFDFKVSVKDVGGFNDTAHIFIYLLRDDQRLKIVLRQQNFEIRERVDKFKE